MPNNFATPKPVAPMPNAIKVPKPSKMVGFYGKLKPGKNGAAGLTITHEFANGGSKDFNFADPNLATKHIKRTLNREWEHPEKNEATAINRDLNIEPIA